ncbi:MAG: oligoribonuclease [Aeriscardovia sp.]|nr:oligoribonuclease [Aeriscardovia sp.]MBR3359526.1 oligoribonuclease [Aeriscardovia sp.]
MADTITYTPEESRLIWIDCEMTGLDIFNDELCEIAVVPTDFNLNILDKGIEFIIKPSDHAFEHMRHNDIVWKMHTDNGLIEQMKNGISYQEAEQRVLNYIQQYLPQNGKAHLAGNTIGSDKKFLDHFMPTLMSQLHYRTIDVSTIKELCRRWYPQTYINKPIKHGGDRALADIIESIDELRYYKDTMFIPSPGLSSNEAATIEHHIEQTSLLRTYEQEGHIVSNPLTAPKADY